MEYFPIIKELCRMVLETPNDAALREVNRLKNTLIRSGEDEKAVFIEFLLNRSRKKGEITPANFSPLSFFGKKDELGDKNAAPMNAETSVPLAEILFTEDLPDEMPQFESDIEEAIQTVILEWTKFDKLVEMDTCPPGSFLIHGLAGTGKTHLAKWIARQIGLPVVLTGLERLRSLVPGETAKNIGSLFYFANRHNCILLLDELDAIVELRANPQGAEDIKSIVSAFLYGLENRRNKGFTIGVANQGLLPEPPGRKQFDIQLAIPRPTPAIMASLLRKFLQPLEFTDHEIQFFCWCLEDSTGADAEVLAKWIRRSCVFDKNKNIVGIIRRFALLNAGRLSDRKREIILHRDEDCMRVLIEDKTYAFRQSDINRLFGTAVPSPGKHAPKIKVP